MAEIYIPPSFRDRPHAAEAFERIVVQAATHPFYRERLADLSAPIPLLTREDIVRDNERLLNGQKATIRTSGSTGTPVKLFWSVERDQFEVKKHGLAVQWMGGPRKRVRLVSLRSDNQGPDALDVRHRVEEQVAFILKRREEDNVEAIISYPSNMMLLVDYIEAHGIDMGFITRIICMSEAFDAVQEAAINRAFPNARIWSSYSAMEVGAIAYRCPHAPEYSHYFAGGLGLEFLNDAGDPCAPGELGRLVITDFYNTMTPLIRYELGDLAAPAECPCGQIPLPAMRDIVGKVRGTLKRRDGSRVVFTDLSIDLRNLPYLAQYQVIQEALESFVVRVVLKTPLADEVVEEDLRRIFLKQFGYTPAVRVQQESRIEKEPSGKFFASICNA